MTPELFIQLFINALVIGLVYIFVVLGLDVILRITNILNFAHGEFYMLGAYAFLGTYKLLGLNAIVSLFLTLLLALLFGCLSYLGVFNFVKRRFTPMMPFSNKLLLGAMGSLGLMMILSQGALLAFGTTEKGIPSIFPQVISVGNITLPVEKLVAIVACALIMIGLYFLFYKTRLGKSLRAVSFDVEASSLQGINTNRIYMVGFMLGCAITGIAGAILAPVYAINTGMGARVLFMALIAMLLGGIGSYKGAILGGFLVGVVLSFGYHFVEQLSTTLLFVIVMVILIFRPGGLLGKVVD